MCLLNGIFVIRVCLILNGSEDFSPEDIKRVFFCFFFFGIVSLSFIFIPCGGRRLSEGARSTAPTTHDALCTAQHGHSNNTKSIWFQNSISIFLWCSVTEPDLLWSKPKMALLPKQDLPGLWDLRPGLELAGYLQELLRNSQPVTRVRQQHSSH